MNEIVKKLLTDLINVNSYEDLQEIINKSNELILNGDLSEEEGIKITESIFKIKEKLGLLGAKKYTIASIRNLIANNVKIRTKGIENGFFNTLFDYEPTVTINKGFGIFADTGCFYIVDCFPVKVLDSVENSEYMFFGVTFEEPIYKYKTIGTSICDAMSKEQIFKVDEIDYLAKHEGQICDISGSRLYPIRLSAIIANNRWNEYYIKDLKKIADIVNSYIAENPDFISSIFEHEEKQKNFINN